MIYKKSSHSNLVEKLRLENHHKDPFDRKVTLLR